MRTVTTITWDDTTTWWGLAQRFTPSGLNWVHLVNANPHVGNPNNVPLGSRITIPEL